jgi:hypothetical protein
MRAILILMAALCWPLVSAAHGLLMDAETDGTSINGRLYYSNGDVAVRESIGLVDAEQGAGEAVYAETDDDGRFHFDVKPSHRYRLTAYGEEGHTVELELIAQEDSRPVLVGEDAEDAALWPPPAWALIGGVLALSLVPAWISKRRR